MKHEQYLSKAKEIYADACGKSRTRKSLVLTRMRKC